MKRTLKALLLTLLFVLPAAAGNFTTLTATIKDPNGTPYASGSYVVTFVSANVAGAQDLLAGSPLPFTYYAGSLDSTGALSVSLPDNGTVTPAGSKWQFNICASDKKTCFTSQQTVTGSSQSLSSALSAASSVIYNHNPGSVNGSFFVNGTLGANVIQSNTANPAATGTERLATTDSITIRNAANGADVIVDADLGAASGNLPADVLQQTGGGYQAPAFISATANPAASGAVRLANADAIAWRNNANGADVSLSKIGAAAGGFPADSLDASGFGAVKLAYVKSANQTLQVTTSNYTTSATTLAGAGVVTGLNFTAPASVASNWSFHCDILYSQATAAAANLWGITTAGTAPTNLLVFGEVLTNQTGTQVDNNAIISSVASTTVITATPSAFGAIGTTADMFQAHLWGTLEAPANASPTQVGVAVASGNGSDALTIYRGSACYWY